MTIKNNLSQGLYRITQLAGTQIRIRYFNQTYDDVYDDSVILTQSGADLWTSGVVLPIASMAGTTDSLLLEAGKLIPSDKKIYMNGSLLFTGSDLQVKVQIGSPNGDNYSMIKDGTIIYEVEGTPIYKKAYLRRLTGSLIGEE